MEVSGSILRHLCIMCGSLALLGVLSLSCGTTDPPSTRNSMEGVIDGTDWRATERSVTREENVIELEGVSAIGTTVRLVLRGDTIGTYRLGEGVNHGSVIDLSNTWVTHGTGSGSATITEIDEEHVVGFFGFKGKDTIGLQAPINVTNGKFDVDFLP